MHAMHALSQLSYSPETGTGFYCVSRCLSREFVRVPRQARRLYWSIDGGGMTVMVVFVETPAPAHPLSGDVDCTWLATPEAVLTV